MTLAVSNTTLLTTRFFSATPSDFGDSHQFFGFQDQDIPHNPGPTCLKRLIKKQFEDP